MNELVNLARPAGKTRRQLATATALTVAASLLVAGAGSAALADPDPKVASGSAPVPRVTTFPRPADPDAPLRAAIEEARKQGKPAAVEDVYTESSRTWAYPDGHLATQSYGGPAQLKQADGSWAWIDTTLVERDGVLKPRLAKADVTLSLGGGSPFASMERDKGQRFALSWLKDLPRPEVTGNVARYVDAAGAGADLVVTALPTGFRHDVLLRERPTGPLEFRIPVATDKLTLSTTKHDGLKLTDSKGKTVMSAPTPRMWDAATDKPTTDRPGRQTTIETEVETKDDRTVLVLKPDLAWLKDPATQYPVTVDPTTTLGITQEVGIRSPNTQISPGYVGRRQYQTCSPYPNCTQYEDTSRALMTFDTAPIAGRQVVKSTMQLMLRTDATSCSAFQGIVAQRITQSWVADQTFWSNQPTTTAEGRSSIDPCSLPRTAGSVWSWDLTAMTQAWSSGTPNHGLMLRLSTETPIPKSLWEDFSFWAQLWGQNVPKLSVDWVLPPEIPTVTAESIDSLNGNDAIARSTNVKVTYKSSVPEATGLDYTVTVNDSTMTPPAAQLPAGEAAFWKFDETSGASAADSSGNMRPLALTGSYSRVSGQLGQALTLAGGQGATSAPVLNTDQSFTVAAWVRLDDSTKAQTVFSQMGVNQPGFSLKYEISSAPEYDQRWWFTMITADEPNTIREVPVSPKSLAKVREWTHLAAQYDNSAHKIRLYVDGVLAGERDYTATWNARGAFEIGRGRVIADNLKGSIDDLHVYQRVLTAAEIRTMVGVPGTTTHNNIPSGQVLDKVFTMDNPASFKFVVKACRSGITPPACNESPAYRITSDAPVLPSDTETGLAEPTQPILSGMVHRPSGGAVTAKYYLYDNQGAPVGSAPLGSRTVNGGERASFQIPPNTVQPGTTYKWQMTSCVTGPQDPGSEEVCTAKTAAVAFTTPGTPPPPPTGDVRHLTLGKDSFVIKTAKTDPTACGGSPCTVTDDSMIRIGGSGADKTAAMIGFRLDELPDDAVPVEALLDLGTPTCSGGSCPQDTPITITRLDSPVTSETTIGTVVETTNDASKYSVTVAQPKVDVIGDQYSWLLVKTDNPTTVTFAEPTASTPPSLKIGYTPAGPPSKVQDLSGQPGDGGAIVSWAIPSSTGSLALLDGYDVEAVSSAGESVRSVQTTMPSATITGLTNGEAYTIKVAAKTRFGKGEWESISLTPRALPAPPTECESPVSQGSLKVTVQEYYLRQSGVVEGTYPDVWSSSVSMAKAQKQSDGLDPRSPVTAKLSLTNPILLAEREGLEKSNIDRTGTSVSLSNTLAYTSPDGTPTLRAIVSRSWTDVTTDKDGNQLSKPSDLTDTFDYSFTDCGAVRLISVVVDVDVSDMDMILEGPGPDGCGSTSSIAQGMAAAAASNWCGKGKNGETVFGYDLKCDFGQDICRFDTYGKQNVMSGMSFESGGVLRWSGVHNYTLGGPTSVRIEELQGWSQVKMTSAFKAANKNLVKNIKVKLATTAKFLLTVGSISIDTGVGGVGFSKTSDSASYSVDGEAGDLWVQIPAPGKIRPFTVDCEGILGLCWFDDIRHAMNVTVQFPMKGGPLVADPMNLQSCWFRASTKYL
ncbi:LamG-like jellyroll fold domain-containing protein [Nonomuraea sp. NPDC005650]|uniref:LamG-like jellyroll fold domain-containing protein n=1 Tax=Nonomuraea sp. NPDC005650 TaxID=3157045 RepID=UPI0033A60D3E